MDEKENELEALSADNETKQAADEAAEQADIVSNSQVDTNSDSQTDAQSESSDGIKFENNDNWKFEAEAPSLDDNLFEQTVDLPKNDNNSTLEYNSSVFLGEQENTEADELRKARNKKNLQIITMIILIIAIIGVVTFLLVNYFAIPNGKEGKKMNYASVAATVDDTKISRGMFNYYYANIVNYYEQYASEVGLDTTKDYKTTYTTDDDGNKISWYDFFKQEALEELETTTKFYTAGINAGITINEEQQKVIDEYVENARTSASAQNKTLDEYLNEYYGEYCSEETLKLFYEQYMISSAYQGYFAAQQTYDEKKIDEYFNEHMRDYQQINVCYLAVPYDETDDNTKAKSQKLVDSYMSKIKDKQSMLDLIPELYKDYISQDAEQALQSYEAMTDEQKEQYIDEYGAALTKEEAVKQATAAYEQSIDMTINSSFAPFGDEISDWLFSDDTPIGAKQYYVISENGYAYIILKTEKPSVDESKTYAVRHILIQPKADDETKQQNLEFTDEQWKEAEEKANAVLEEVNKDKSELAFALLSEEKNEDTASTVAGLGGYYGGLYAGTAKGQMVAQFEDWAFDSSRKYGDTDIVKTDYGYHIMFFVNQLPKYKADALNDIKYDEALKSVEELELKTHDKAIESVIEDFYATKEKTSEENTDNQ